MHPAPRRPAQETRGATRRRVLLTGKLIYGRPEMTQDCAIVDMSRTGARIRLKGPEALPQPIYLIVVQHALAFEARQARRRGPVVGLSFLRYFDLNDPPRQLPTLVRRIWAEQVR